MGDTLLSRFLRYVQFDTQSSEYSKTTPSTPGQWDLLRLLRDELLALGASQVELTEHGYVLASIPPTSRRRDLPTVAFLAHVDTAPAFPGKHVRPIVHKQYNGRPIRLPEDKTQVIEPGAYPELNTAIGKDLVTASGKTLLGADDKAGVAVVMSLAQTLLKQPEIKHGPIRVCFNPDEEVGQGVERLGLDDLGANVAYTLDGENPGEVVWETFSGDKAVVTIEGVSTHPGEARRKGMVNAVHLAGRLLAALPRELGSPESTREREGFTHPYEIRGDTAKTEIHFILRDHDLDALVGKGIRLKALCRGLAASEPRARFRCRITPQYRNMGYWLKDDMTPVELASEACRRLGLEVTHPPARGGTDGSRPTERGLPTSNLFCGGHNAHGPLEWVAVQDMELAVKMLVELIQLWERKGAGYRGYRPDRKT